MGRVFLIFILIVSFLKVSAQSASITLNECYALSMGNYPLIKQQGLIASTKTYTIENARNGLLPQIGLYGQATYQSDVTGLPIKIPGTDITPISKDQYKVYSEVTQVLYDGGATAVSKELAHVTAQQENAQINTEIYKLRENINQLYFGILLINSKLDQIELRKADLQKGLDVTLGAIENGVAYKSNADFFRAELISANQIVTEQTSLRRAYLNMLGVYTGQVYKESTFLVIPEVYETFSESITRPEIDQFEFQKQMLGIQSKMIDAKNRPRVGLFVQGGYGRPALNFLKNDFVFYALGGLRFSWHLSGLYTAKGEKHLLNNNSKRIDIQKNIFLFHTQLKIAQESELIRKWRDLIEADEEIVVLRNSIKNTAAEQLKSGVKLPADYIREVNAENMARENLSYHKIQLLAAQYSHKVTLGQ